MDKNREFVKEYGTIMKVKKGETIYQIGENIHDFYFIEKGIIKIATDSLDGKATTVSLNGANEFFGFLDFIKGERENTNYAVALSECTLYSIPIEFLHKGFVKEHILFDSIVKQLERALEMNVVLSTMTVPERLRWLLIKTATKIGEFLVNETPLTHEEMANYLGCSRQKISNYISKWKKEGSLVVENRRVKIIDKDKLK